MTDLGKLKQTFIEIDIPFVEYTRLNQVHIRVDQNLDYVAFKFNMDGSVSKQGVLA